MPTLFIVLEISGSAEDAFEAVDKALDAGALQDAINDYSDDEDTDDDEDEDADEDTERSSIHVTSAIVCGVSDIKERLAALEGGGS